ncbi:Trk-type K+ transport system, membrane component [Reinekea sp. MED297]|uniref:Trk system potassium uptake protein n=2 Tax=Reinekea TaxID=230494 RepID=A4BGC5_9GAMM|nr:Trk-type K+ transport system, membrane component [Reinekea sp. MED297] [Reinekea blandensis MED297]
MAGTSTDAYDGQLFRSDNIQGSAMVLRFPQILLLTRLVAIPVGAVGGVLLLFGFLSVFEFHDHLELSFLEPGLAFSLLAMILSVPLLRYRSALKQRMAPLFALLAWVMVGLCAAIPITLVTGVSFSQAVFESFSALTTTGATVLSGLDDMSPTFLMYRQFLQWLGGLGVVVFVVAILPHLDAGGMKLLKAEVPGPSKDEKLISRTRKTAHALWGIYLLITIFCAIAYHLVGLSWFDAIAHSFSTVSTGGFSTHDASLGFYRSEWVYLVSDLFMLLGAINFALHFAFYRERRLRLFWENEETRTFLIIVLVLSLLVFLVLPHAQSFTVELKALNHAFFILISFITSTGFGAENFTQWPNAALFLLLIGSYLGGCAGSTAGGSKILRIVILFKLVRREIRRLVHPRGVFAVRYQGRPVQDSIVRNTLAFFFFMLLMNVILVGLMMIDGLDLWTAITAVTACINVLGPAFGTLANNFQPLDAFGLDVLTFAMVLGRLEYLTLLVLFIPQYWRR